MENESGLGICLARIKAKLQERESIQEIAPYRPESSEGDYATPHLLQELVWLSSKNADSDIRKELLRGAGRARRTRRFFQLIRTLGFALTNQETEWLVRAMLLQNKRTAKRAYRR
jgi:hypothetical protein